MLAGAGNNAITFSTTVGLSQTVIDGGDGDDTISMSGSYGATNITVAGGNGADTLNYAAPGTGSVSFWGSTGQDTLNVNSGTFTPAEDAQNTTQDLSINLADSSILVMNASQHLAALKIQSTSRATLSANGSRVLVVSDLDSTGKLDLTNNDLIVQATAATRQAVAAAIEARISSAYNTSPTHWQGNGIASSTAASTPARTLGVLLNSPDGANYTQIDGQSVDENSIIVRYTVVGDLNLDRSVSINDFITLASNFGQSGGWSKGDLNYDTAVTISDFIDLTSNFNQAMAASSIMVEPQSAAGLEASAAPDNAEVIELPRAALRKPKSASSNRRHRLHHRHRRTNQILTLQRPLMVLHELSHQ